MAKYTKIVSFNAQSKGIKNYQPSVYERFTKREREIYYNCYIKQWESHWEVADKLGVKYGNRVIIPDCYKSLYNNLYNKLIKDWNRENRYEKPVNKRVVFPACRFSVLSDESESCETQFFDDDEEEVPSSFKKPKIVSREDNFEELHDFVKSCDFSVKSIPFRNVFLLNKIKNIIFNFVINRSNAGCVAALLRKCVDKTVKLEAQMDMMGAQGEKVCPEINSYGNTLQETHRDASIGQPAKIVNRIKKYFSRLASAESSPDYAALTDRFFPHGTYEWKGASEHPSGKTILSLKLPFDFINGHQNAPNCTLFNSYSYWDGDIEVKIMVNSNKFQVGQLQMSWYYGQDYEENFGRRDNIFTASQQAHCLVSASTSNEGLLYIPFRYYKPKMGCKYRADDPGYLNMGNLSVRVINELSSPSTTYKACTYTISFRFVNSNFSGMVSRDLGSISLEPNMFAVRAAMRVLEELNQDPQRDNPPIVSPPNAIVPWSSHSWSVGDKLVEPVHAMRLAAPGQTPHPAEVTPEFDEMSIQHVVSNFGLLNIKKWKASDRNGTLIFMYDGSPVQHEQVYHSEIHDGTVCYSMPPVAVISNLFAYWRGSIELRLDVIASPFHTGRLLIAYIPRVMTTPTMEQAKGSPHMIIDLQGENRQFVFKIPYIADRPWWHNRSFGNAVLPPSRIYCFVLNELVPMDNVINEVDINVYMRGCDDFEVSIPVSPRIGLSTYNATVKFPLPDMIYTRDGYTPFYVGNWRYFEGGKKKILRYGAVTDHIVQFANMKKGVVYTQDEIANSGYIYYRSEQGNLVRTWWIVGCDVDCDNDICKYGVFFSSFEKAKQYAKENNNDKAENWTEDSQWFVDKNNQRWDRNVYMKPVEIKVTRLQKGQSFEFVERELVAQMDERSSVTTTCEKGILNDVASTNSGLLTFGESFSDLKTLCRRYQIYTMIDKPLSTMNGRQSIKIPVLPQGLVRTSTEISTNDYYNLSREGIIPLIASGYRFYRGGLRFRFVWKSSQSATLRIEHRPDERLDGLDIQVKSDHRKVYNDGYALVIQNTAINNIIEIEVPFYQCGLLGLLQRPKIKQDLESYHFGLGNLYVSVMDNSHAIDFKLDVYYSLADDCRFSVFQGFPMMMWAPNFKLEAQMLSSVRTFLTNANSSSVKINTFVDKMDKVVSDVDKEKFSMLQWITHNVPKHLAGAMINGISQIFHCFINPTIKTVAWALTSFLASIGVLCTDVLLRFSEMFSKLLSLFRCRSEQADEGKQEPANDAVEEVALEAQMDEQQKDLVALKAGIISTVISSIAAALGSVGRLPRTVPDFLRGVWNNMGKFSLTTNALCTFFKNNLMWITDCYKWVLSKICPKRALATEVETSSEEVKAFVKEALELTSAVNERKVEINPKWNIRVYKCAAMANILYMKFSMVKDGPKTPALFNLMMSVLKLRDKLVRSQLSPPIRFEPFVLCFSGGSNIGKSHLCQEISKHMLREINYKTYQEIIYTRTPGNPYWNQLRSQPVCLYDDFCAIGGEYGLQQAGELFCLKSRAIFNPPQAEIADKHIRYNPLIVLLATNQSFPKVAGVENNEAFYRRRDLLIQVEKDEAFYLAHGVNIRTGSPKDFPVNSIKDFQHLNFKIAEDVRSADTQYGAPLKYTQLVEELNKRFRTFYSREMELYTKSLNDVFEFYPDETDDILDFQQGMKQHAEKIDQINQYRFGSIEELKVLCNDMTAKVENMCDSHLGVLFTLYATLCLYDKKTVKAMIMSNQFVINYCAATQHLVDWFYNTFSESIDTYKTKLEANMESCIEICNHQLFSDEFYFENGKFKHPVTKIEMSEEACNVPTCPWKDRDAFMACMTAWRDAKYHYDRAAMFSRHEWHSLPKYFTPSGPSKEPVSKDEKQVTKEVESWFEWSKRILCAMGNGLWDAIKWAGRILSVVSSIFVAVHLVSDHIWPERVALRKEKKMLTNGIVFEKQVHKTIAERESNLVYDKLLLDGKHPTQQEYSDKESQMVASGDLKTFGKTKPAVIRDVAVKMVANMSTEKEHAIIRLLKRNTLFLEANYEDKIIVGRILGLVDHFAVCVDHYNDKFSKLDKHAPISIVGNGFKIMTTYDKLKYRSFENSSLGYLELPLQVPPFKNLIKHMAKQKDHRVVGPISYLVETHPVEGTAIITEQYCERVHQVEIPSSNGFDSFTIPDGYKYTRGGRGICGSVLVSNHLEHPIYGIHVAGDVGGRIGISEAITAEQFSFLLKDSKILDVVEGNMYEFSGHHIRPNTHHSMLGVLPYVFGRHESGESKVIPTVCHGKIFSVRSAPPVLSVFDERIKDNKYDPLLEGINKHGLIPDEFPDELIDVSADDLDKVLKAVVKPMRSPIGKVSEEIAVIGSVHLADYDKLDFNTSEGFPFSSCRPVGKKSKLWMLNVEETQNGYIYKGCDPLLAEVMKIKHQQRSNRELPFTVFTDCLKDRKLSLDKATTPGKVRVFSISPLDFTIQCRQYFLDFNVAYKNARLSAEHAIGIDVNSLEWSDLALKLLSIGNNIVTADYSNYGPTLMLSCVLRCIKIIRNWYRYNGDEDELNDLMREMMGFELIHSIHLARRTVYRTLCGLPSGSPMTVILNTLVGSLYVRISWKIAFTNNLNYRKLELPFYILTKEKQKELELDSSFKCMFENLIFILYGDDVIKSVSNRAIPYYNCKVFSDIMNSYNIVVKNATKNDKIVAYNSLLDEETTFLKSRFIPHPKRKHVFLAALDRDSVEDTCNWTFKEWQHDLENISLESCQACVRNAFGWGPEYFSFVKTKCEDFWFKYNRILRVPDWNEIDYDNYA